jgi:hypothetical protein
VNGRVGGGDLTVRLSAAHTVAAFPPNYLDTLSVLFDNQGKHTASQLHLSVQAVTYRLDQSYSHRKARTAVSTPTTAHYPRRYHAHAGADPPAVSVIRSASACAVIGTRYWALARSAVGNMTPPPMRSTVYGRVVSAVVVSGRSRLARG